MQDQDEFGDVNSFNEANGLSARSTAEVEVSCSKGTYAYRFSGTGFDSRGNIVVIGRKGHHVHFVLRARAGAGIVHVEFPADGDQALQVGLDPACPPTTDNPQFKGKKTQAQVPGGRRDLLKFRDAMTSAGDFAYQLTFHVERTDGTSDTPVYDPMVANRPY
jgi:hypothetical protein